MKTDRELVKYCIERMLQKGAEKAQCYLKYNKKHELNVDAGEMKLLRTNFDTSILFKAIINDQKGDLKINKMDKDSLDSAIDQVIELARSSRPDKANDIADKQPPKEFTAGREKPDLDLMYDRLHDFVLYEKEHYPQTMIEQSIIDFTQSNILIQNSNGVDFEGNRGLYSFSVMFTSKEGEKASSFNYSGCSMKELAHPLHEYASVDMLLGQSSQQIHTSAFPGKMVGDVIITPDCLSSFIYYITAYLSDYSLISGSSIYKDKLDEKIANEILTLHSYPRSPEIAKNYFFTRDGFEAQNMTIIDKGVLKSFLLSQYGANKTGKPKAVNSGGCYIVEPGTTAFEDMVSSIDKGLLLCRFSGGNPSDNGDFSGVAKNSYLIENGKISKPVNETMIAGNLAEMIKNIANISKERIDYGSEIYPWIHVKGITVSGK
ncbi:MAG: TldD/PmbA family protein [Candidatus Cloacimonetes bacterium]|nr:TldD/PmbA family protein [Candidatus Cloacimonadota bacterium]